MKIYRITAAVLFICLMLAFSSCGGRDEPAVAPSQATVDPYAGLVSVPDGSGGYMWVKKYENVAVSRFDETMFALSDGEPQYIGQNASASVGIDVSFYQGEIDWNAVAASGVEFAIIRVGYRGYTEGAIFEDECFRDNMNGAASAGLKLGVYFYSQAVSAQEAEEEARFVLERIASWEITMPVVFDWEDSGAGDAGRTYGLDGDTVTDCAVAFCNAVSAAGYTPAVYFYRYMGYHVYDLDRISGYRLWYAAVEDWPSFYYDFDMWQYSYTGQVDGISTDVDLNMYFY